MIICSEHIPVSHLLTMSCGLFIMAY